MSTCDVNPQRSSARARIWASTWLVFLAAIFGFGWYKAYENQQHWAAVSNWNRQQAEFVRQCKVELERVRGQLHLLHGAPGSQKELERQFQGGKPFELRELLGRDVTAWDDPIYGIGGKMEFQDGVLMGWRISGPKIGNFALRNPAPSAALAGPGNKLARWISWLGFNFWVVALVAWFALPGRRLLMAQVMLAAALAAGTAWLVNPAYSMTARGILSNDLLAFGAIMIGTSVFMLAATSAALPDTVLTRPRFRMRHLLLVVTLVALLFAVGPFGYVTLLVAVSGVALFALVYQLRRWRRPGRAQIGMDAARRCAVNSPVIDGGPANVTR